jgi:hypothetical protein
MRERRRQERHRGSLDGEPFDVELHMLGTEPSAVAGDLGYWNIHIRGLIFAWRPAFPGDADNLSVFLWEAEQFLREHPALMPGKGHLL